MIMIDNDLENVFLEVTLTFKCSHCNNEYSIKLKDLIGNTITTCSNCHKNEEISIELKRDMENMMHQKEMFENCVGN
jgi:transcription elongation factor Elf1